MHHVAVAKVLERSEPFDILDAAHRERLAGAAKVETWPIHPPIKPQKSGIAFSAWEKSSWLIWKPAASSFARAR